MANAITPNADIPVGYTQTADYIIDYKGTFSFILDLRSKLIKYRRLSDGQWAAAKKVMEKEKTLIVSANAFTSGIKSFDTIKCKVPITTSFRAARSIAKDNGWKFNPMTLLVHEVLNYDGRKMLELRVSIDWTGNATSCRCCGKPLTDWRSQATGVGPVCVKHTSIPYVKTKQDVQKFQAEMLKLCESLGVVTIKISKWAIDEKSRNVILDEIQKGKNRLAQVQSVQTNDDRANELIAYMQKTNSLNPNVNLNVLKVAITNILKLN